MVEFCTVRKFQSIFAKYVGAPARTSICWTNLVQPTVWRVFLIKKTVLQNTNWIVWRFERRNQTKLSELKDILFTTDGNDRKKETRRKRMTNEKIKKKLEWNFFVIYSHLHLILHTKIRQCKTPRFFFYYYYSYFRYYGLFCKFSLTRRNFRKTTTKYINIMLSLLLKHFNENKWINFTQHLNSIYFTKWMV